MVDRRCPYCAAYTDVVGSLRLPAQVEIQLAGAHFNFEAAERQASQVQMRFAGAKCRREIERKLIVESQVPDVGGLAEVTAARRLLNREIAARAAVVVADLGVPRRHVLCEI